MIAASLSAATRTAYAQAQATGSVTGRVLNVATGQYLRNAQVEIVGSGRSTTTDSEGSFSFQNVPAGSVTLAVTYTGLPRAEQQVTVPQGGSVSQEISLRAAGEDSETITLTAFVVSNPREGNAKAIVDQRQALNVKTVIAADAFGDVSEGNVGEFLKLLPGISVDYVDADVRAVRVRGLPPKYANFTIDGHPIATSASSSIDTGRQFEFEQVSIATLDVVEINKSPTADMPASNLAGNINTVSKSAFSQKGRVLKYSLNTTFNQYAMTLRKTPGWDDEEHFKTFPGGSVEFSDTFFDGKLGVVAAINHSGSYTEQRIAIGSTIFDRNPDNNQTELPIVSQWNIQHGLKPTLRDAVVVNLDYRATDDLRLSLRTSYNYYDAPFYNRNWLVNANTTGQAFLADGTLNASALTGLVNRTETSAQSNAGPLSGGAFNATTSYAQVQGSNLRKHGGTFITSPALSWKRDNMKFDAYASYSQSRNAYESGDEGFFSLVQARMPGFSWQYNLEGDSGVKIQQVSTATSNNASVFDLANYTTNGQVNNERRNSKDQFWTMNADFEIDFDSWKLPTKFKIGGDDRLNVRDIQNFNPTWVLNTNPAAGGINLGNYQEAFRPNIGQGVRISNISGSNGLAPSPDKWKLYELFQSYDQDPFGTAASGPFTANGPANLRNYLQNRFDITEEVWSAYAMATVEINDSLTGVLGVRYEKTETQGRAFDDIGHARASTASGTTNTNSYAYINTRYGSRVTRTKTYDNFFPSAQLRYEPRKNLVMRGAYFASILRPDFASTVGGVTVTTSETATVPPYAFSIRNTELEPETANNFDVQVEYYFEPVGAVSLGAFYKDIKDIQVNSPSLTIDPNAIPEAISDLGFTAADLGSNSTITTRINAGKSYIAGLEASYQQELSFLPGIWRGFGVTANATYVKPKDERLYTLASGGDGIPEYTANFILRYKLNKFSAQISANWTDTRLTGLSGLNVSQTGEITPTALNTGTNTNRFEWNKSRLVFGFNANYALHRYATLFLNISNFTNEPQFRYVERQPFTSRYGVYGATFNLGVKGSF
jgi:iron complex outermembrane recepter protein